MDLTLVYVLGAGCFIFMSALYSSYKPSKRRKMKPAYIACSVGMLIVCGITSMMIK